jgi:hypothetical protein
VKKRVALVTVPFYFINLLLTSFLNISILLVCVCVCARVCVGVRVVSISGLSVYAADLYGLFLLFCNNSHNDMHEHACGSKTRRRLQQQIGLSCLFSRSFFLL